MYAEDIFCGYILWRQPGGGGGGGGPESVAWS